MQSKIARRFRSPVADPLAELSFVGDRVNSRPHQFPRCFWTVKATGNYGEDCQIGHKLALEYLAMEEADVGGPGHLQMIVQDMPRELTGIEIGFLTMVSFAAGSGADAARRTAAYWEEAQS